MRETSFIRQNKDKWQAFEEKFEQDADPEKVSNLFIQITDDLSYARTYYPNRSVKIYLNNLAQRVFQTIYRNRVRKRQRFALFWKEELPQHMYNGRRQLLFTFLLFAISFLIGMFSSMHDPQFARFILGDEYVAMTEQNIASGDPMAVYKEMNQFDMLLGITLNNLWVSFLMLAFGIFFGVGTAYFIVFNGIMIGAFQYFFIERGLFWESFLTIWVHGALEVSAIVIAGMAGITLGKGLLFPGTYTRLQSFRKHGLQAVQIFMGVAPVIVLAAINESFLTRYTETPDVVRGLLIAVEFGFMFFYYIYYPRQKAKLGFNIHKRSDEIPPDRTPDIRFGSIKTNGQIFSDSFQLFRSYFLPACALTAIVTILWCAAYFLWVEGFEDVYHEVQVLRVLAIVEALSDFRHLTTYRNVFNFTTYEGQPLLKPGAILFLMNVLSMSLITAFGVHMVARAREKLYTFSLPAFLRFTLQHGWKILGLFILLHSVLLIDLGISRIIFFACIPACMLLFAGWSMIRGAQTGAYFFRYFLQTELLFLPLILLSIMMACLSHSMLAALNVQLVTWNIPFDALLYEAIQDISITAGLMFTIFMMVGMMAVNMGLLMFSLRETETADDLQQRIQQLVTAKNQPNG